MDFSTKTLDAKNAVTAVKTGALVVGIYENRKLSKAAGALDKLGAISAALKSGDISGKPGSTLLLRGVTGIAAERIVLLGLGADEEIATRALPPPAPPWCAPGHPGLRRRRPGPALRWHQGPRPGLGHPQRGAGRPRRDLSFRHPEEQEGPGPHRRQERSPCW
jgi:hypothetical protein